MRKSAVCVGYPFPATGVGFAITAACVVAAGAAVELVVELVVVLADDVASGCPPATSFPPAQEYCVVS